MKLKKIQLTDVVCLQIGQLMMASRFDSPITSDSRHGRQNECKHDSKRGPFIGNLQFYKYKEIKVELKIY